jgi:hypothetical protein
MSETAALLVLLAAIALQGHDPKSTVYYKNIRIKSLR